MNLIDDYSASSSEDESENVSQGLVGLEKTNQRFPLVVANPEVALVVPKSDSEVSINKVSLRSSVLTSSISCPLDPSQRAERCLRDEWRPRS